MRPLKNRRIMVVDDEQCIADTLTIIFRNSGYDAVAYYDGQAALEACKGGAPDLLLSDLVMPGMDGIELAIRIRKLCPGCRVLLFTGLGTSSDLLERTERLGFCFEVLEKPTPPDALLEKIATTLGHRSPLSFPQRAAAAGRNRARNAS